MVQRFPPDLPQISPETPLPDVPAILAGALRTTNPDLARWLERFAASWQAQRELGDPRRARCLLVEYDTSGRPVRGRMRTLEGKVETLKGGADTDEVILDHQVRAPDDPFVGTVYGALAALRNLSAGPKESPRSKSGGQAGPQDSVRLRRIRRVLRTGGRAGSGPRYRGRFTMHGDGGEVYGGDSIGVAAFAVAYGDWWGSELHRARKLIGDTVAFTGAIDAEGGIRAIAGDSLTHKLVRALHSPVEYVVVPEANRAEAEASLARLRAQHPRRRLRLIGIEHPADIITDYNVLRPEKLCPSEFAVRTVAKLTRSVKVQVPVLLMLLYALVCVIEPRAWIFFDWKPTKIEISGKTITALNAKSQRIWTETLNWEMDSAVSRWLIEDLDADGSMEVAILPKLVYPESSQNDSTFLVFSESGDLLFRRPSLIEGQYPGPDQSQAAYAPSPIYFLPAKDSGMIVTVLNASNPGRAHIRLWSPSGAQFGWYINAGYASARPARLSGGGIAFLSVNNREGSFGLVVLPSEGSSGCAPPYKDPVYDLREVKRGNQENYLLFPVTDLCRAVGRPYGTPGGVTVIADGTVEVWIIETGEVPEGIFFYLNDSLRVDRIELSDRFWTKRSLVALEGKLPIIERSVYERQLLESVRYWSDSGWVSEGQVRAAEEPR